MRPIQAVRRLPLRVRLVLGFAAAMLLVLIGAAAFVYWRVEYALDARLKEDLAAQASDLQHAAAATADAQLALTSPGVAGRGVQLLDPQGQVLAAGPRLVGQGPLVTPAQAAAVAQGPVHLERGWLFSGRNQHIRILAVPVEARPASPVAVAVATVRMDQRDEALRELLAQLTVANLAALAIASLVGYRLARAALQPVERYRARAEQIAAGATGVRLDVPLGVDDEVSRLGHTLNAMLAEQERAADRQQQFIDDASHELRTPLTVLAAEIDVALRRHRSADEYEQTLRRIAVSTGRLVQLADDLLALGAQGAEAPTFCPLYAADLLDEVADRARALLGAAPSRPVRTDAPLGLVVSADRALLARALGNAVDNAVRYGDGSITLTAAPLTGDAASGVVLAVHDDGPGMPADFLPHAAERFRQAQRSRTGPGSGLGLSLVDAIAAAHRGQLRICSNGRHHGQPAGDPGLAAAPCRHPAAGTTASLLLPTRPVPDRALPTAGERIAPVGG